MVINRVNYYSAAEEEIVSLNELLFIPIALKLDWIFVNSLIH